MMRSIEISLRFNRKRLQQLRHLALRKALLGSSRLQCVVQLFAEITKSQEVQTDGTSTGSARFLVVDWVDAISFVWDVKRSHKRLLLCVFPIRVHSSAEKYRQRCSRMVSCGWETFRRVRIMCDVVCMLWVRVFVVTFVQGVRMAKTASCIDCHARLNWRAIPIIICCKPRHGSD